MSDQVTEATGKYKRWIWMKQQGGRWVQKEEKGTDRGGLRFYYHSLRPIVRLTHA